MKNIPGFIQAAPLYILPAAQRAEDRVVPADRLRIEPDKSGALLVSIEDADPVRYATVFPCLYRPTWNDIRDPLAEQSLGLVQGGVLPDGEIVDARARKWFATADGQVHSVRAADARAYGRYSVCVEPLQIRLAADWIADSREPMRRRAHIAEVAGACLEEHGWDVWGLNESGAIARKEFQTAVGIKDAHAYLGPFDSERCNCTLSGEYLSEGRNQLESHSVLIPWDASPDDVRRLTTEFATGTDDVVGQTYAARLHASRGQRGG